jgi:metal-responsive CopG/Arc/MetJ family transcriptional regulator
MTKRRRAGLYLDEVLLAGLDALKQRDGIPASEAVRRAIVDYLQKVGISIPDETRPTGRKKGARRR